MCSFNHPVNKVQDASPCNALGSIKLRLLMLHIIAGLMKIKLFKQVQLHVHVLLCPLLQVLNELLLHVAHAVNHFMIEN